MKKLFAFIIVAFISFNSYAIHWVGHRGARGLYPENTTGAMLKGLSYPDVWALEFDVAVTKDNQVVVTHEPWMNPDICLDPAGNEVKEKEQNFYQMTYAEIEAFDCGSKYNPKFPRQEKVKASKPLLKDLLAAVEAEAIVLNHYPVYFVEIKAEEGLEKEGYEPNYKIITERTIAVLEQLQIPTERIRIASLNWDALRYAHQLRPKWKTVAFSKFPSTPNKVIKKLGFKPTIYGPMHLSLPSKLFVNAFQRAGIEVFVWTVNSTKRMKTMIKRGVNGIITDYPDLITEIQ